MKKLMAIFAAVLLSSSLARATLIDLTPGGFDLTQPFPLEVQRFFGAYGINLQNLAGANIVNGQVVWSPFTPFGDNVFDLTTNGPTGAVGWDLIGTGARMRFVFVESADLIAHLYGVRGLERFIGLGQIEVDGQIPIIAVTFAGSVGSVPDKGHSMILFGMGLCVLSLAFPLRRTTGRK